LAERRIGVIAIMGVLGLIVLYAVLRWPLSSTEFGIIITLVSLAVGVFLIVLAVRGWDIDDRERVLLAAAGEGGTQWWRHVRLLRRVVLCVFGGICLLAGLFIGWLVAFHPG